MLNQLIAEIYTSLPPSLYLALPSCRSTRSALCNYIQCAWCVRAMQLLVKLLFIAHLLGSGWYFMATLSHSSERSWVLEYRDGALLDATVSRQYVASLYWALMTLTTVGYGDIVPANNREDIYSCVAMLIGAVAFAYTVGDIGALIVTLDRQAALVEEKMDAVKEYLGWRGIPRQLAIRVRRYYEHYYAYRTVFDEESILSSLNPSLHSEIVQFLVGETVGRIPLVAKLSPQFQEQMFPYFKPLSFAPQEVGVPRLLE